jgi:hypothetical protein
LPVSIMRAWSIGDARPATTFARNSAPPPSSSFVFCLEAARAYGVAGDRLSLPPRQ